MTAFRSSPSATTASAPSWRSDPVLPGDRVVAVTWWPAAVSIGIRLRPITPVPPATNTRMVTPLRPLRYHPVDERGAAAVTPRCGLLGGGARGDRRRWDRGRGTRRATGPGGRPAGPRRR